MKNPDPSKIEKQLQQMAPVPPSPMLDRRIKKLFQGEFQESGIPVLPAPAPSRPKWRLLSSLGLALSAGLAGLFLGLSLPRSIGPLVIAGQRKVESSDSPGIDFANAPRNTTRAVSPLTGEQPRLVEEEFKIIDDRPMRVFRLEGLDETQRQLKNLRKTIVVPSQEI